MSIADKIPTFSKLLNVFETGSPSTDYRSVFLYHDGNGKRVQVTLGRGFTSDGGSLQRVLRRYIQNGGPESSYIQSKMSLSTPQMVADKDFLKKLRDLGSDPSMQKAQDEIFTEVYLNPALDWFRAHGFTLPLSAGVIVDSYLHSGSIPTWLTNKFPEKKPDAGGNEKEWIMAYLGARLNWLASASQLLRNTVYRPKFFLSEISKSNWEFNCPLTANGTRVC